MSDAWETLLEGSAIADGDAWEHLSAQGGGGGDPILVGVMPSAEVSTILSAAIQTPRLSAEISTTVDASLSTEPTSATIINTLEAEI